MRHFGFENPVLERPWEVSDGMLAWGRNEVSLRTFMPQAERHCRPNKSQK